MGRAGRDGHHHQPEPTEGLNRPLPLNPNPKRPKFVSIASFALAQLPVGQAETPKQVSNKPPSKRTIAVASDALLVPEPR